MRPGLLVLALGVLLSGCGTQPATVSATERAAVPMRDSAFLSRSIAIPSLLGEIFAKYDHNRNGMIEIRRDRSIGYQVANPDELFRSETAKRSTDGMSTASSTRRVYSRKDMFRASDADQNGLVTRAEVDRLIRKFDHDNDGQLLERGTWGWLTRKDKLELDNLNTAYGESLVEMKESP